MSFFDDIKNLNGAEVMFTLLFISGGICPGFLTVWNFSPELIKEYGIFVILVLSAGLTLPLISVNALGVIFLTGDSDKKAHERAWYSIAVGSFTTMFIIDIPLLISYFESFCIGLFVSIALTLELLFVLFVIGYSFYQIHSSRKLHQKDKSNET